MPVAGQHCPNSNWSELAKYRILGRLRVIIWPIDRVHQWVVLVKGPQIERSTFIIRRDKTEDKLQAVREVA